MVISIGTVYEVLWLQGNSGGPIQSPAHLINIIGTGVINVVGDEASSTLTIQGSGSIASRFNEDSGSAIPVAGMLNIVGGNGIQTTGSGNTVTIAAITTGFKWNVVTSASNPITLTPENGYITKGGTAVQFTLPASAAVGDTYKIVGYGNLWSISQNANQDIILGTRTTTVGVGGSITATSAHDCAELVCVTANLEWIITDSIGNLTFV